MSSRPGGVHWLFGTPVDNSYLTCLRAMYGTRNLEWRAAAFLIVSRPGRQAMVDLGVLPELQKVPQSAGDREGADRFWKAFVLPRKQTANSRAR